MSEQQGCASKIEGSKKDENTDIERNKAWYPCMRFCGKIKWKNKNKGQPR